MPRPHRAYRDAKAADGRATLAGLAEELALSGIALARVPPRPKPPGAGRMALFAKVVSIHRFAIPSFAIRTVNAVCVVCLSCLPCCLVTLEKCPRIVCNSVSRFIAGGFESLAVVTSD
jgi:hypothetical protein